MHTPKLESVIPGISTANTSVFDLVVIQDRIIVFPNETLTHPSMIPNLLKFGCQFLSGIFFQEGEEESQEKKQRAALRGKDFHLPIYGSESL